MWEAKRKDDAEDRNNPNEEHLEVYQQNDFDQSLTLLVQLKDESSQVANRSDDQQDRVVDVLRVVGQLNHS